MRIADLALVCRHQGGYAGRHLCHLRELAYTEQRVPTLPDLRSPNLIQWQRVRSAQPELAVVLKRNGGEVVKALLQGAQSLLCFSPSVGGHILSSTMYSPSQSWLWRASTTKSIWSPGWMLMAISSFWRCGLEVLETVS